MKTFFLFPLLFSSISAIMSGTIGIHYGHVLIHFKVTSPSFNNLTSIHWHRKRTFALSSATTRVEIRLAKHLDSPLELACLLGSYVSREHLILTRQNLCVLHSTLARGQLKLVIALHVPSLSGTVSICKLNLSIKHVSSGPICFRVMVRG